MKQDLYHWLYQMDLKRERFSKDDVLRAAMLNMVKFYTTVHKKSSHLVGPVNLRELLIDPENGHFEVKIDGDREALMHDIDSVKFMPPEVLNNGSRWSLAADRFVLAELLFTLRYCKHPYDGKKVLEQPVTDVETARQRYGSCRFIFDPDDQTNGLDYYADPNPVDSWKGDSKSELKEAFIQVFTHGYLDASLRLSDKAWEYLIG